MRGGGYADVLPVLQVPDLPAGRQATKQMRCPVSKYSVNPWSAVEVAIRALPQERFAFCRVLGSGPDCTASPVRDE
ncbi:MAG: hypothetical protein ACKVE3_05490 [Dissulfuribacterales bacterium]